MRILKSLILGVALLTASLTTAAIAQEPVFAHKGIAKDADRYETYIRDTWKPDGRTSPDLRLAAEKLMGPDARAASRTYAAAVVADRKSPENWIGLAKALLAIKPDPDKSENYDLPVNASGAAYRAYMLSTDTAMKARALAVLGEAMQRRSYWRPAIDALKTSLALAETASVRDAYEKLRTEHGFRMTDYTADGDAATPRVCIQFSESLSRGQSDFAKFVSVNGRDPQAVSVEGSQLCIDGIAGKHKEARASYDLVYGQDGRTLRTALAFARHAAIAGDRKKALLIIDAHIAKSQGDGHPLLRSLRAAIESGATLKPIVTTASEGMAEVFYGLGEALIGEGAVGVGVLYMQMALYVEPEHQFALAALASAYEGNKQYADAIKTYERIPVTSPLTTAVEIRKAFNLNSLDKVDEARQTLSRLLDTDGKAAPPVAPKAAEQKAAAPNPASELGELADGDDVLRLGDKGDGVQKLQSALKSLGYDVPTSDGRFGVGTRSAVMAFQKKNKMRADGVAGPATIRAIAAGGGAAPAPVAHAAAAEVEARMPLTVSDKLEILDALGNILRARKLYAEAVPHYDQALALVPKPERRHWVYYYARGTSYERLKNWSAAEADLEKALTLYPDQPLILNYLGYSWIDQGRNLKEGMSLIEKAVALKPEDGYIVDSLGWAHYMQGNFDDAVRYLERAVELEPNDPVLNDHLGDALWRVGREREAKYQWDQALTLKPAPEDEDKIKKKLESGLSAALPTADGNGKQAAKAGESNQK